MNMEESTKKSITEPSDLWKFRSKEVRISEMDKRSVATAALHAMKKIYYYNKQYHYCDYKIKISTTDKEVAKYEAKKADNEETMMLFAHKLELLEKRAPELGFEIPEDYEEMKNLLSQIKKEEETSETSEITEEKELVETLHKQSEEE